MTQQSKPNLPHAWLHVSVLSLLLFLYLAWALRPYPQDDFYLYQAFAEKLAEQGRLDFTISGYHGLSFVAAAVYFFTGWSQALIGVTVACAILIAPMLFLTVRKLFTKREGYFAVALYLLMPWLYTPSLRGFTDAGDILFGLLAVYLILVDRPLLAGLSFGYAIIITPFIVCFAPFFLLLKEWRKRFFAAGMAALIVIPYVFATYRATGQLVYGAGGRGLDNFAVERIFYNLGVFVFQAFSVPFVDGNSSLASGLPHLHIAMHVPSPVVVLAAIALLYPPLALAANQPVRLVFFLSILFGTLLTAIFLYTDTYYTVRVALIFSVVAATYLAERALLFPVIFLVGIFEFWSFFLANQNAYFDGVLWPIVLLLSGLLLDVMIVIWPDLRAFMHSIMAQPSQPPDAVVLPEPRADAEQE